MRYNNSVSAFLVFLLVQTLFLAVVGFTRSTNKHGNGVGGNLAKHKLSTNPDSPHQPPMIKPQDITPGGPSAFIIHNPKAFNIYYGSTWTQTKMTVLDNFAANIGATDYWSMLNSTMDTVTKRPPAPLKFVGSLWDGSKIPTQTNQDADAFAFTSNYVIPIIQAYVTAKKIKTAGDFDLARFDLNNTIFSLLMAPGWDFVATPSYCGWHQQIPVIHLPHILPHHNNIPQYPLQHPHSPLSPPNAHLL